MQKLIATSKTLQRLVQNPDKRDIPLLSGWRREVVGNELLRILEGESSVGITDGVLRVHPARA